MARFVIGLLIGLLVGSAGVYYFFVGVPSSASAPGALIQPPNSAEQPAGTAEIVLKQEFFNGILETIFRDMQPPTFPLTLSGAPDAGASDCRSEITILREGSGVQTSVRLDGNKLSAPMAFSGRYDSLVGCLQFSGWAQANMDLRFDAATQSVFGQINVETVNLDGVNPVLAGLITPLVQSTLNGRVNPVRIVDGRQIGVAVPIAATNSNLRANVSDVRAEVKQNTLYLYVIYDFRGTPIQPTQ